MSKSVQAVGMAWYLPEEYDAAISIMSDRDKLSGMSYEVWLQKATTGEQSLIAQGHTVVRAIIHPEEFRSWCNDKGLEIDSKARMAFANEVAIRYVRSNGHQ